MFRTRTVHIIDESRDPSARAREYLRRPIPHGQRFVQVLSVEYRPIESVDDLRQRLARHTSPFDVPRCTPGSLAYLREIALRPEHALCQFALTIPDYAAEEEDGPRIIRSPLPEDTLVLGHHSLSRLMLISRRESLHAIEHGLIPAIEVRLKGHLYRYAIVGEAMQRWSERYARWVPLEDAPCTWWTRDQLYAAARKGKVRTDKAGRLWLGFDWLEWAASRRRPADLHTILANQVRASQGDLFTTLIL